MILQKIDDLLKVKSPFSFSYNIMEMQVCSRNKTVGRETTLYYPFDLSIATILN